MLAIKELSVSYGHINALDNVSIVVSGGTIVSIIGSNGAGKTTLLNTISGLVRFQKGSIEFKGSGLSRIPHHVVKTGIVHVPEGRKVFSGLTVKENLIMGGYLIKDHKRFNENIEKMLDMFPILRERQDQHAGTLSGGEQQMLAICRGLMSEPKMILLDEPSLGLSPIMAKEVFKIIQRIKEQGITVLLVEQNAKKALALSDYAYVLENGKIVMDGPGRKLLCDPAVKKAYLGEKKEENNDR